MANPALPPHTEPAAARGDSAFDASAFERALDPHRPARWEGWRLALLAAAALFGALVVLALARWMAATPFLPTVWQATARQQLRLLDTPRPELAPFVGRTLQSLSAGDGPALVLDARVLQRSPRWQVDDGERRALVDQQGQLARALAGGPVTLRFSDGASVELAAERRGWRGLGLAFWPLAGLSLLLLLAGASAWLARPEPRNALYGAMAAAQGGQIAFIALQSVPGLGLPAALFGHEMVLRLTLDGVTAAAAVHVFALHPHRLRGAGAVALAAWAASAVVLGAAWAGALPGLWWWAQGLTLGLGAVALGVGRASYRAEPNPLTAVMQRLGAGLLGTLVLLTVGAALASGRPGPGPVIAAAAVVSWSLFFAALLLLAPWLSRSRRWLREFALLAGVATVAAALDLLFVTVLALGPLPSLTLALCIALGVYVGARQRILRQLVGGRGLSIEGAFDLLYRAARELQAQPQRHAALQTRLFRDLFDPLQATRIGRAVPRSRVLGNGSALLVPLRDPAADEAGAPAGALVLRFAQAGRRLFTHDDAVLADRMVEQLRHFVAFDRAVESGRREERLRIAQDLHDDIGARLLTLMYQARDPEMEEYLRNTLKDLKTLTRGLAAAEHRLSDAAAEWKADLAQRFQAARVEMGWAFETDDDLLLSMGQWSSLTRMLRELASNVIAHAQATRVDVGITLRRHELRLVVADDGQGAAPDQWTHGLGLGGVRKRAKWLGGEVRWRENVPRGVVCELCVRGFGSQLPKP